MYMVVWVGDGPARWSCPYVGVLVGAINSVSSCDRAGGWWSGSRDVDLAGATTWTLARDDDATDEDLTTPDTPGLLPLDRAGQALGQHRAVGAERLRVLDVLGTLGEEQLRVIASARELVPEALEGLDECSELHLTHLLSCLDLGRTGVEPVGSDPFAAGERSGQTARPRIPCRVPRPEEAWLVFAYKGGLHPWEPERALVVMPPVPRTEISPGAKLLVDAMTRTRSAHSEAATSPWVRAYTFVVIFTGHLLSGARMRGAGTSCARLAERTGAAGRAAND